MTPLREALVVPCLFLTVALLGGLRLGTRVLLVPPPLVAMVLAILLIAALVRSRAIAPERLMHQQRTPLENLCGLTVLLTLFAGSSQVFNLVTPDRGLLHLLVSLFFFVQLLTTLAAVRDRVSMLRGLAVLLGSAFVLRFIALESWYAPGQGLMKRVMTTLLEGVTLGSLEYQPAGAATGYVAFLVLLLYLVGLVLVGASPRRPHEERLPAVREKSASIVSASLLVALCVGLLALPACRPVSGYTAATASPESLVTPARDALFASATVWEPPVVPVGAARLGENPAAPWSFTAADIVTCRFVVAPVSGTTSKFNCQLPSGEVVKVKYGARNPELFAEVAATRLVAALGFPADRMYLVSAVRCVGCPAFPFQALRCHAGTPLGKACFAGALDSTDSVDFTPAVIEHRANGRSIETPTSRGWSWYELDRIDPARGGSPRHARGRPSSAGRRAGALGQQIRESAPRLRRTCQRVPKHDRDDAGPGSDVRSGQARPAQLEECACLDGSANLRAQHGTPALRRSHVSGNADHGRRPRDDARPVGSALDATDARAVHGLGHVGLRRNQWRRPGCRRVGQGARGQDPADSRSGPLPVISPAARSRTITPASTVDPSRAMVWK